MTTKEPVIASAYLQEISPEVGAAFKIFRDAARNSGPLDHQTCEFILMAGFAAAGYEQPFKNHARRALDAGVAKEALRQVVLLTLGSMTVIARVVVALSWIEEVYAEFCATQKPA